MYVHQATLEFEYENTTRATIIADSVTREIGTIDGDRSRTTLERSGSLVTLTIDAVDPVALRAALNTWFSLVDVAEQVVAVTDTVFDD